jgi:thymidine kinase
MSNKSIDKYDYSGKIELIIGPMFSGKTTTLLTKYRRYMIAGKKVLLVKNDRDTRYDVKKISTHDGVTVDAICCNKLSKLDEDISKFEVICIDEIQFYPDAVKYVDKWANMGLVVIASGLNGTFERKPFEVISQLIPMVENITFLTAVCKKTGMDAVFSKRLSNDKSEILIGGEDLYQATSRRIYFK